MGKVILKRGMSAYCVLAALMAVMLWRVAAITRGDYTNASGDVTTRTITISRDRGKIYDAHGELLVGREYTLVGAVKPTASALATLQPLVDKDTFAKAQTSIQKGYPVSLPLEYDPHNPDITVFRVPVRYDSTAVHVIGYTDETGENGVSGIEKSFDDYLKKNTTTQSVSYSVDACGRMLSGDGIRLNSESDSKAGVMLTLEREVQTVVESALDEGGVDSGAAVVMKVGTGEISAMASRPYFQRDDLAKSLEDEASPLLNKALCAYAVGSVFKPFVAAAGIESGADIKYSARCNGSLVMGDTQFGCYSQKGHGCVDLRTALIKSCNVFFIGFSQLINHEYLLSFCENFGFGRACELADTISGAAGTFPESDDIKTAGDYANLSFGQGFLSATPIQLAAAYSALVGGGVYRYPSLVKGTLDADGTLTRLDTRAPSQIMSSSTSEKIRELMTDVVEEGIASAKPFLTTAGGKTGTAQSGILDGNREICRTWFAGFFPADNPEYVVVVLKEDGKSGSQDCAPIFRQIADGIASLS